MSEIRTRYISEYFYSLKFFSVQDQDIYYNKVIVYKRCLKLFFKFNK